MPNHIKNKLTITGNPEQIEQLIEKFSTTYPRTERKCFGGNLIYKNGDYFGWWNEETQTFSQRDKEDLNYIPEGFEKQFEEEWTRFPDFQKIKPMPEILIGFEPATHIIDHAKNAVHYQDESKGPLLDTLRASCRMKSAERGIREDEKELVARAIDCYNQTGYFYWYEWCPENWGTKWNSYSCNNLEDNIFTFETAWSGVPELLSKMLVDFPDVQIFYQYADEDTGSNCGQGYLPDCKELEDCSLSAYELAFELRPDDKEYYTLVDGKYEYTEE